jgi:hypothetical protein
MTAYRHHPAVLSRRTAETVLLRTLDGRATLLRGTGIALWDALAHPASEEELVETMRNQFDDPSTAIADDVASLVERLQRDALITPVDEP